jgi:predicted nucleic acid-binding Zn ribbon protein
MSFLYHRRTKRVIHVVWAVIAVLIIVSMVFFFAPGVLELFLF